MNTHLLDDAKNQYKEELEKVNTDWTEKNSVGTSTIRRDKTLEAVKLGFR